MCVGGCCWPPPSPDQIEAGRRDHRRPHLYSRSQPASRARHDFFDNKYESYNNIEVDDDDLCNPHCGCSSPEPSPPPPPLVGFATAAAAEEEATSFMLSFSRRALFPAVVTADNSNNSMHTCDAPKVNFSLRPANDDCHALRA